MRILGIIPARGGSKGLPRKNIRNLHGKPLIAWTISAAVRSRAVSDLFVSTEDEEIAAISRGLNCAVLPRPHELALDDTTKEEVCLHALRTMGQPYDLVVWLQPTSPLRSSEDIAACIHRCDVGQASACVSLVRAQEPPSWMFTQTPSGMLEPVLPRHLMPSRRQDLPQAFLLNGAVYVARTSWLELHKNFLGPGVHGHEMPVERSLDIDTIADFQAAEAILKQLVP